MRIPRALRRAARRMQVALTPRATRQAPAPALPVPGPAAAAATEVADPAGAAALPDTIGQQPPGARAFVLLDLSRHEDVEGEAATAIAQAVKHARRDGIGLAIMPPPAAVADYLRTAGDPELLTFLPELRAA